MRLRTPIPNRRVSPNRALACSRIRGMNGLSPLVEQVRFHESWRGYDPAEVDAYVERVEKAAAWAQNRIETLSEPADTGSAHPDEQPDSGVGVSAEDEARPAAELAQVLASAQQDADEVTAAAREQVEQMVAEARSRAQAMIAGAHAEATRIRREADEHAASTVADIENLATEREAAAATAEREQHLSAIAELAAERARQAEELDLFEHQVAERREEVEKSLSRLVEVVESAEIFRTVQAPHNGHSESVVVETDPGREAAAVLSEGDGEHEELPGGSMRLSSSVLQAEAPDRTEPESDNVANLDASAVFDDEIDSLLSEKPTGASDAAVAEPVEPPRAQTRFVTVEDLEEGFSVDDGIVPWDAEQDPVHARLFDEAELSSAAARRREEEPFLSQLREAANRDNIRTDTDDALSAFFSQEEDQRTSPWFLGGR